MVADVVIIQTCLEHLDELIVAISQVEDTTIAVKIKQAFGSIDVPDESPFTAAHNKIHTVFLEKRRLAGRYVIFESTDHLMFNRGSFKVKI